MPVELRVPPVGESITEVYIGTWHKNEGDRVERDENVVELESEKATFDVPAPAAGVVTRITKKAGETAAIGEVIAYLEESATAGKETAGGKAPGGQQAERSEVVVTRDPAGPGPDEGAQLQPRGGDAGGTRVMPAAARVLAEQGLKAEQVEATGPGGRLLKEDVVRHAEQARETGIRKSEPPREPVVKAPTKLSTTGERMEEIVPMSPIRRRIAQRLVEAQQSAALLTTFNEVDMSAIKAIREKYGDAFQKKYEVKLGFMSFFVKAVVDALQANPQINAEIRGTEIVYFKYCDIGVAIGGGKGLVVPVLRNAETLGFADIEMTIANFAARARKNELQPEELRGGTFTITNGGVYGSLLSTPIVNPPQSGVLGMHGIQERPIAVNGQVEIRPMMYLALTYDHRLVDGREAVTFLKRIKDVVEDPSRMLLDI